MARVKTGNFDFIALRNSYHGMSNFTMGVSALATWKQPTRRASQPCIRKTVNA